MRAKTKEHASLKEMLAATRQNGNVPHKFSYIGGGSRQWNAISKDPYYALGVRELRTLNEFMKYVNPNLPKKPFNILHIGPGNGVEIPTIVNAIGIEQISHYALIDISAGLMRKADSTLKKCGVLRSTRFLKDVSKPGMSEISNEVRRVGGKNNLILLLANGAILSNSPLLSYIRNCMKPKDVLVITLEVYSKKREKRILEQYKLPSIVRLFSNSLFRLGIKPVALDEFDFAYNKSMSVMETFFSMEKWAKRHPVKAKALQQLPNLLRVFASLKPTVGALKKKLTEAGFYVDHLKYFTNEKCCGVVCSRGKL